MKYQIEIKQNWEQILRAYQEAIQDGRLDKQEVGKIMALGMGSIAHLLLKVVPESSRQERKAIAVALSQDFYEKILRPMDLTDVPDFVERTVVDPAFSRIFPKVVGSIYDGLAQLFDELKPETNEFDTLSTPPLTFRALM